MNLRRAFTLIELLVVIAIIAILAAILFPVFAQAKEAAKKTATLSQYKQVGTATAIYIGDADDVFPLSFGPNGATGGWRIGSYHAVPNGWTNVGGRDLEPRKSEEAQVFSNSLMPYIKNDGMYSGVGLPDVDIFGATGVGPKPTKVNLSYNGMLHGYSATAVAAPSRLPLMAPLMMKQNLTGAIITSPALDCLPSGSQVCRFSAGAHPSGNPAGGPYGGSAYGYVWWGVGNSANFSLWQYGKGMTMVATDTSAKFITFNAPIWPQYANNVNSSPWSSFAASPPGSPYWMTDCVSPGKAKGSEVYYPGYFRPDSEFNWKDSECDYGGG